MRRIALCDASYSGGGLLGWGWSGVGFVDVDFQLLKEDEVGGVEAADLLVMPEEVLEFAVGVERVDLEFVLLLGKAVVYGSVVGGLGGVRGILDGAVADDGTAGTARGAESAGGVVGVAGEATFIEDENEVGVVAGAAQRVSAPFLDCVLDVEDAVAGLGVEGDVGDVAGVAGFDMNGLGGFEGFGEAGVFGLGGCESGGGEEHQEYGRFAVHGLPSKQMGLASGI